MPRRTALALAALALCAACAQAQETFFGAVRPWGDGGAAPQGGRRPPPPPPAPSCSRRRNPRPASKPPVPTPTARQAAGCRGARPPRRGGAQRGAGSGGARAPPQPAPPGRRAAAAAVPLGARGGGAFWGGVRGWVLLRSWGEGEIQGWGKEPAAGGGAPQGSGSLWHSSPRPGPHPPRPHSHPQLPRTGSHLLIKSQPLERCTSEPQLDGTICVGAMMAHEGGEPRGVGYWGRIRGGGREDFWHACRRREAAPQRARRPTLHQPLPRTPQPPTRKPPSAPAAPKDIYSEGQPRGNLHVKALVMQLNVCGWGIATHDWEVGGGGAVGIVLGLGQAGC
jgi:hypothetical protein